jgi:hypothetical protein
VRQLTIRENAEATRAKTIRVLGATILISWSVFLAQVASAAGFTAPRTAPAAEHSTVASSVAAE